MLAQRQPSFKECVTAHWSSGLAPKMIGAKFITEAAASASGGGVGERSMLGRRATVRTSGACRREYAGMSSEKTGEIPVRRKPKVSWAMSISSGSVGA